MEQSPRCQYSLRTLLLSVAMLSVFLAWFAYERAIARQRCGTMARFRQSGAVVTVDANASHSSMPGWLAFLLGYDADTERRHLIGSVSYRNKPITDDELMDLSVLPNLTGLDLEGTAVSDAGLAHLSRMRNLRTVVVTRTNVSARGMEELRQKIPQCEVRR